MEAPLVLVQLQPGDKCYGMQCNDYNPCTLDYCTEGECAYTPLTKGSECGEGLECDSSAQCVPAQAGGGGTATAPPQYDLAAIVLITVLIAAGITAVAAKSKLRGRKRGWF